MCLLQPLAPKVCDNTNSGSRAHATCEEEGMRGQNVSSDAGVSEGSTGKGGAGTWGPRIQKNRHQKYQFFTHWARRTAQSALGLRPHEHVGGKRCKSRMLPFTSEIQTSRASDAPVMSAKGMCSCRIVQNVGPGGVQLTAGVRRQVTGTSLVYSWHIPGTGYVSMRERKSPLRSTSHLCFGGHERAKEKSHPLSDPLHGSHTDPVPRRDRGCRDEVGACGGGGFLRGHQAAEATTDLNHHVVAGPGS